MTESGFWLDGTHDPPPNPVLPDPLAGLLTGATLPDGGDVPATRALAVAAPVAPQPAADIQASVTAMFAEGSQVPARLTGSRQRPVARPANATAARPVPRNQGRSSFGALVIVVLLLALVAFLIIRSMVQGVGN